MSNLKTVLVVSTGAKTIVFPYDQEWKLKYALIQIQIIWYIYNVQCKTFKLNCDFFNLDMSKTYKNPF